MARFLLILVAVICVFATTLWSSADAVVASVARKFSINSKPLKRHLFVVYTLDIISYSM
jgi:hypothetical protein